MSEISQYILWSTYLYGYNKTEIINLTVHTIFFFGDVLYAVWSTISKHLNSRDSPQQTLQYIIINAFAGYII